MSASPSGFSPLATSPSTFALAFQRARPLRPPCWLLAGEHVIRLAASPGTHAKPAYFFPFSLSIDFVLRYSSSSRVHLLISYTACCLCRSLTHPPPPPHEHPLASTSAFASFQLISPALISLLKPFLPSCFPTLIPVGLGIPFLARPCCASTQQPKGLACPSSFPLQHRFESLPFNS